MLPARNNFWFDKKTDPTDDHKHEAWQINLNHELHLFSLDPHLKATRCIGALRDEREIREVFPQGSALN